MNRLTLPLSAVYLLRSIAACCVLVWSSVVLGVVIETGDGSGNTSAPADDPGFSNVGTRGVGTAIYLGNRWVLTAAHLGVGDVTFGGQVYSHLPNEAVQLGNPAGMSDKTDLRLLRLEEDPGLPSVHLPCSSPELGSELIMIGNGHDRQPDPTFWSVDEGPGEIDDVWRVVESEATSDRQGFRTLDTQSLRWGKGSIGLVDLVTESGAMDVMSFTSSFSPDLGVEGLSQAVRGDSGGAALKKNFGVWELIGLVFAVDPFENQPGVTRSAIYGNSTFIADVYRYAEIIRDAATFEPEPGDVNGDGEISASEIDLMFVIQEFGLFGNCHFDVDGNDQINSADLDALLVAAGTLPGDSDLDGTVGFSDFLIMSRSFGKDVSGWGDGDFDGDGQVSFADFLELSGNFGTSAIATEPPRVAPVPEPSRSNWILAVGLLWWYSRDRRIG